MRDREVQKIIMRDREVQKIIMRDREVQKDVISRLLNSQLDYLLTKVLLYLDPGSLHQVKLVCVAWCVFIQDNIWDREFVRRKIQGQHLHRWKKGLHEDKT